MDNIIAKIAGTIVKNGDKCLCNCSNTLEGVGQKHFNK